MLKLNKFYSITSYFKLGKPLSSVAVNDADSPENENEVESTEKKKTIQNKIKSPSRSIITYLKNNSDLGDMFKLIPSEYLTYKGRSKLNHLYLADKAVARNITSHILPSLLENKNQVVAEANAGLGLITAELLRNGVETVRMYEACSEFSGVLKYLFANYLDRIEVINSDIYHLSRLAYRDRFDNLCRVDQVLRGIPRRNWDDDPAMTIIGPMPNLSFIDYLSNMLSLQQGLINLGRIQIFALMRPIHYFKKNASLEMGLHIYQVKSIIFQLFFDYKLLNKYPRKAFLPWETKLSTSRKYEVSEDDAEYMYLVQINFKKVLPVEPEYLLHFFYFLKQGFRRGKVKIIPTLEKWLPGIGLNLIIPRTKNRVLPNISIFTEFRELNPEQILEVFLEMIQHPEFRNSPFIGLVQADLLKSETIETGLDTSRTKKC